MRAFAQDPPIEERVGEALRATGSTVAVAEGCTGGLVGALLTAPPGASEYFDRSTVAYAYDANRDALGVARETLDAHGAVSAPVAEELARRARDLADTTWGLSVTGIAGPGGGTEEKPVGTGFAGVAYAAPWESGDSFARAERHEVEGDRTAVRERLARAALRELLRSVRRQTDG